MRIVFMGTPDFAACSLKMLCEQGHEIAAVFTQPDRPKNRGHKLTASPVKELALERGIPVYQPTSLKAPDVMETLTELKPEMIAVVAYGKLLPTEILNLPRYGCVNIHGSLLPKYRGAAPIQWSVLNGEPTAGVTAMHMAEELDAGDIIAQIAIPIERYETSGELYERLAWVGAKLLCAVTDALKEGTAKRIPQNPAKATYAPPLSRDMSSIDWTKNARDIVNQIHGLNPWPTATAVLGGTLFKLYRAELREPSGNPPGSASLDRDGLLVSAAEGDVLVTELQAAGGKRMKASDYLRGHPLAL